jgi:hypothetical protein
MGEKPWSPSAEGEIPLKSPIFKGYRKTTEKIKQGQRMLREK